MTRTELISDLEQFVNYLKNEPELDNYNITYYYNDYRINVDTKEDVVNLARILKKDFSGDTFSISRNFGHVRLRCNEPLLKDNNGDSTDRDSSETNSTPIKPD